MTEEQIRQSVSERMESSFSSLIDRGPIPRGAGYHFQQAVPSINKIQEAWAPPSFEGESAAVTIYQYSALSRTVKLGDGSDAPKIIEKLLREKDIEEYRKLCTVVPASGPLKTQIKKCEDRVIRDGGGEDRFFWIPCDDGAMVLFHPWVMKRLHLENADWFGRFDLHGGEWVWSVTSAYQPRLPRYGFVIAPQSTEGQI